MTNNPTLSAQLRQVQETLKLIESIEGRDCFSDTIAIEAKEALALLPGIIEQVEGMEKEQQTKGQDANGDS